MDYYTGYRLEHRYQLSTQSFSAWIIDELKGSALFMVLGLIIIEIIYSLIRSYPSFWWLIAACLLSVFFIIMTKLAPTILIPIFFTLRRVNDPDLESRILALMEKIHAKVNGIFEMDLSKKSKTANAALAGIGKTRQIILSDTLLDNYSHDEIEVIMAHELGHHVYNHLWKGIFVQSALIFSLLFVISQGLRTAVSHFQLKGITDIAGLPFLLLVTIVFSFLFLPLVNLYLRHLEYQADLYGVSIIGKSDVFIQALEKLCRQNLCERDPHPIIEFIFYSHPSVSKRVGQLSNHG